MTNTLTSTFDSGNDGWVIGDFNDLSNPDIDSLLNYDVSYQNRGGNGGGYILSNDPSGNDFSFSAPKAFLGNQLSAYNNTLSYDIYHLGRILRGESLGCLSCG